MNTIKIPGYFYHESLGDITLIEFDVGPARIINGRAVIPVWNIGIFIKHLISVKSDIAVALFCLDKVEAERVGQGLLLQSGRAFSEDLLNKLIKNDKLHLSLSYRVKEEA